MYKPIYPYLFISAGTKATYTTADTFELTQHSLFKLKKYEGLVYSNEHKVAEIKQITHRYKR